MTHVAIRPAQPQDAEGIARVCAAAFRATYADLAPASFIDRSIADFYGVDRIGTEIAPAPPGWLGYLVAVDPEGTVLGAAGGGVAEGSGELYVLYLDPTHRREGIGTALLDAFLAQLAEHDATEVWVSVLTGNERGIPFYRAKGFTYVETRPAHGSTPDESLNSDRMRKPIVGSLRAAVDR